METLAADVWAALDARSPDAQLFAHGGSNRSLPWFYARAWFRAATLVLRRRVDVVVEYDAVTFIVLWPVLAALRVPQVALVNGLDLTWRRAPYPSLIRRLLPRAARVVAISDATAEVARGVGVREDRLGVVRPGVGPPSAGAPDRVTARGVIEARLGLDDQAVVLFTLGRLVRRKGVRWFVSEVMPKLPSTVHYVVAGSGPEAEPIAEAMIGAGLEDRVHLLGSVSDSDREIFLAGADLFIQPNVVTPGDMEGFGLVIVEATTRGTPALASAIEGMSDAVAQGAAGMLCPPGDVTAWVTAVTELVADREMLARRGRRYQAEAESRFGRDFLADRLMAELAAATNRTAPTG